MTTVVQTPRLVLREMRDDDLDDLASLVGDPDVMRYYPRTRTRAEARAWIERNQRRYREDGHGLWTMLLRASDGSDGSAGTSAGSAGVFAGDCGLTIQRVDGVDELEVGYHVRPDLQRTGLATEAAIACRDLARDRFGARRLIAIIHPDNLASRRVAEKTGLTLEKRTTDYGAGDRELLIYATVL
jgi:RimJ/RimL family protein N-acetyltransferase